VTRSEDGLAEAASETCRLAAALNASDPDTRWMELENLLTVASLTAHAAWMRTESRGVHMRLDHPDKDDAHWLGHTVFCRGRAPRLVPAQDADYTPFAWPTAVPPLVDATRSDPPRVAAPAAGPPLVETRTDEPRGS
jgi:succinate dehydrogenase/fumarate reductase flavoprotein subunit